MTPVENFILHEHGWVPNNGRLPVLVYRNVTTVDEERAADHFEALFERNGWPPQWRGAVYTYHHYHSSAHEALGVAAGSATLMLGGPHGRALKVVATDAIVLPTGTGHCCVEASSDFMVVGAYPRGQDWDICRDVPSAKARTRMWALPIPPCDPVGGETGPLVELWK